MAKNKQRVFILNTLKPIDDVRSYYKIGKSLQSSGYFDVAISGFPTANKIKDQQIKFYPYHKFKRKSIKRLFIHKQFLRSYKTFKPHIIIFSTFEVIPSLILLKLKNRKLKLYYDVQENYQQNVVSNQYRIPFAKSLLKNLIRIIERSGRFFINGYMLAETTYYKELYQHFNLYKTPNIILQNKFRSTLPAKRDILQDDEYSGEPLSKSELDQLKFSKPFLVFIISGTITNNFGIHKFSKWFNRLLNKLPNILVVILGHSVSRYTLPYIMGQNEETGSGNSFSTLLKPDTNVNGENTIPVFDPNDLSDSLNKYVQIIVNQVFKYTNINQYFNLYSFNKQGWILDLTTPDPMPFPVIERSIPFADFAVAPYLLLPGLKNRIPTKFYDYAAYQIPMLIPPNPEWDFIYKDWRAGCAINFDEALSSEQAEKIFKSPYYPEGIPQDVFWYPHEHQKLIDFLLSNDSNH